MKRFLMIGIAAIALSGCVALGVGTQQGSEDTYAAAAGTSLVGIKSGKIPTEYVKDICSADVVNYNILISTRSATDGVKTYALADGAHALLQAACNTPVGG